MYECIRRVAAACGLALTLGAGLSPLGAVEPDPIPIGAASVDITPDYPVRLHGYNGRPGPSVGIQSRLHAKALALGSDAEGPSILITVDNLGVPDAVVEEVSRRLLAGVKIPRTRLAIASSHTHSAPCLTGNASNIFGMRLPADQQAAIDRYTRELTDALEGVALKALQARSPGQLSWGAGRSGFAINRRVVRPQGGVRFGETPEGPVDHAVPFLLASDPSGRPWAVVVGYACHCTTLDPKDNVISADWAGYAREGIEAEFPGAIALTVIGCGADANPTLRTSVSAAKGHGYTLAAEVARVVRQGKLAPVSRAPVGRLTRIPLPFDALPSRESLQSLAAAGGPAGYNAQTQLERWDRAGALPSAISYPIQVWDFGGDLLLTFLGGEVVVDYSTRLKRIIDPKNLFLVAYANDVPCYIPSERILNEGGYEADGSMVYYGHPTRLARGVEDRIVDAVRALTPSHYLIREP